MKYEWFGFNQEVACELNLNIEELAALRWLIDFKSTDGMKKYVDENNDIYYWVNYKYFAQECPIFFKNKKNPSEDSIRNKVQRLFSNGLSQVLEKKTIKYTSATTKGNKIGTETYFRIIPEVYQRLISSHNSKMSNDTLDHNSKMSSEYHNSKMSSELNHNSKMSSNSSININSPINDSSISCSDEPTVKNDEVKEIFECWINNSNKNNSNINIYSQVVEYLNEKANTKYRATSKKTKEKIDARLNEGYTLEDFKTVIDNKVSSWSGTEYELYLRPETLFGPKFEGYLNEKPKYNKFNTTQRTYTTNVTNKAAKEATTFYNAKSDYVPDYKKNYDAKSHNPKGHDNFEISSDMQKFTTNENFANDMERKLLGWDDYEESENPYMN